MNNKTIELLKNIETAVTSKSLSEDQINLQDIIDCTIQELVVNRTLIPAAQYDIILSRYAACAKTIITSSTNKLLDLTNLSLLTLNLIPDSIHYFTSEDWWRMKLSSSYTEEHDEVRRYIASHGKVEVFNYPFTDKYSASDVQVLFDEENGHHYIIYKGKKMFFPLTHSPEEITSYCKGIFMEQDSASPHSYNKEGYNVEPGDVIVDAGVAEGNFALDNIDIASHIYLIEADPVWVDALQLTFKDYSDKVTIIPAYLDSRTYDDHICIDDLNIDEVNYIKMDIEGFERDSLIGAAATIERSQNLRVAICSYHNDGDEQWIKKFLSDYNFETAASAGLMFIEWLPAALVDVIFRKGIVFGRKK